MKRFFIMFGLSFLAVACTKSEQSSIPANTYNMTFEVRSDLTKTVLNGHDVTWEEGDKVCVFDDVNGLLTTPSTVTGNKITASIASSAQSVYSLYPYDAKATISGSVVKTTLPPVQTAVSGSFSSGANLSLAYTSVSNKSLTFKNACALVKFRIDEDGVKSVKFIGNKGEALAGTVSIDYNSGEPITSFNTDNLSNSVILKGNFEKDKDYYIIVVPQVLSGGFSLWIEKEGVEKVKSTSKSVSLVRNKILDLGTITGTTIPVFGANLVVNPGFESATGDNHPEGWTWNKINHVNSTIWVFRNNTGHNGSRSFLHIGLDSAPSTFEYSVSQAFTGLAEGLYRFEAWGYMTENKSPLDPYPYFFVKGYSGADQKIDIDASSWHCNPNGYKKYVIDGIYVDNGTCEIGVWAASNSNGRYGVYVDDFSLIKLN